MTNIVREFAGWIETDTGTNAAANAQRAAPSGGLSHYITTISGTFDSVADADMILSEGATELARWHVYDAFALVFPSPIKLSPATLADLELAAGGTGVVGSVTITGYTA